MSTPEMIQQTEETATGSTERQKLIAAAEIIWRKTVDGTGNGFEQAFTDWGSESNVKVWALAQVSHGSGFRRLAATIRHDPDGTAAVAQVVWFVKQINDLRTLACAVEFMDTGRISIGDIEGLEDITSVSGPEADSDSGSAADSERAHQPEPAAGTAQPTLPATHSTEVAAIMAHRREEAAVAQAGGRVADMAVTSAKTPLKLKVRVDSVEPLTGRTAGMSQAQIRDLSGKLGTLGKVDRIDMPLMELAQAYVSQLLDRAQITLSQEVSRPAIVSAALAVVLRSAGVPGLVLNPEGEMLCELLGSGGDLERSASIDARLQVFGNKLDRLERQGQIAAERAITAAKADLFQTMVLTFSLAEKIRLVKLDFGAGVEDFNLQDPAAVSLREYLGQQAEDEWRRQVTAKGRPSAELAQQRRLAEGEAAAGGE